jgi:hypothetical protein
MPSPVLCHSVDKARREAAGIRHNYAGSTKGVCFICAEQVWIGPKSLELIDDGHAVPVCETCVKDALGKGQIPRGIVSLGNPEKPSGGDEVI